MSVAPARWDWLWALLFPIGLLLAMGTLLLHSQIYPFARLESLALLGMLVIAGAVTGLVMHHSGRVVRALLVGILVAVFLNYVVEWSLLGIRSRYNVPGAFLIGFALSWFLGRNLHVIGTVGGLAMAFATLLMPAAEAITRSANEAALPSGASSASPPVMHLILDGHQGVETLSAEVPESAPMKTALREFYAEHGFRLYGGAFSRNTMTRNALPDLLNFSAARRDSEFIRYGVGMEWILQRSEYFRRMAEFGYRIHVYQSDVMDFCTEDVATCTTVRFRSLNWIEQTDVSARDKFRLVWTTFLNRSGVYAEVAGLYSKAVGALAARTSLKLSPLSTDNLQYTPLSMQVLARLLADDMPRFGPGDLVFVHLLIPHHPFALDTQCRLRGGPSTWYGATKEAQYQLYLEQMTCTNRIVADLLAATSPAAHIVIHGDHGARLYDTDDDTFGTLFAARRPNQPADYVRTQTGIDELLVRELLQPLGVPVPPLPVSGATIKRMIDSEGPLQLDIYENPVSTASGN